VVALIDLAKQAEAPGWSAKRREQLFREVLARDEADRERRRVRRAFAAGAAAVLVVGVLWGLVSVAAPWRRSPDELAEKAVSRRHAAE
jgi:hypothetical protein